MKPHRILLAGWALFLLFTYPGFMKSDAADMLVNARTGIFTGVHPPIMELLWRVVGFVISGPVSMLVVLSTLLLAGAYALLRRIVADRTAAIIAVVVLVFPPLMFTTALVSSEAALASFLVAGAALLPSERRGLRIAGLGLLVIACGVRTGGALAVIPIILASFRWVESPRRLVHLGVAAGAALAVVGLAFAIERAIVAEDNDREEVRLAMNDIVGSLAHGPSHDTSEILDALSGVELSAAAQADPYERARMLGDRALAYSDPVEGFFAPSDTQQQRDQIRAARWSIIRATPGGYLAYRWHFFKRVLGVSEPRYLAFYAEFIAQDIHAEILSHTARHSLLQSHLISLARPLGRTFLFRPYFYLVLAIALLPLTLRRRQMLAVTLLASGLFYELSVAFTATRAEFRDSHWLAVTVVLVLCMLGARRREPSTRE